MAPIGIPRLLGERSPKATRLRRIIRSELLARRSLAPTDHDAIRQVVEDLLSDAAALCHQLRDNPKDEQKRRLCLALITEVVYLASDDEGLLVVWLLRKCIELTGITRPTPLLPLALKAYGPYDYEGDAQHARISDGKVSRDYKAIIRGLSPDVLPPDLVNFWNQPGRGINASSRPQGAAGAKQNSRRTKRISSTTDAEMHERFNRQADRTKMILLAEKKGSSKSELQGMVTDRNIVQSTISHIRGLLAKRRQRPGS